MNLIFVGSEATAYYSGATACEGVFLTEEVYNKHKAIIDEAFSFRHFGELDGKHSEVEGEFISYGFNSAQGITEFIRENDVNFEMYTLTEYLEEDISEEVEDELIKQAEKAEKRVREMLEGHTTYTLTLTDDEYEAVTELLEEMRAII